MRILNFLSVFFVRLRSRPVGAAQPETAAANASVLQAPVPQPGATAAPVASHDSTFQALHEARANLARLRSDSKQRQAAFATEAVAPEDGGSYAKTVFVPRR